MSGRAGHSTRWRREIGAVALTACVTLAACAWVGRPAHRVDFPHLVWPEPPARARIELVTVVARATDLGIERSVWSRLAGFITGGGEVRMVRPAGVAASGPHVAVADPGAGVVHWYDLAQQRALALQACEETAFGEPVAVALLSDRLYVSDAVLGQIHVFGFDGTCSASWRLESGARPAGLAADEARQRLYIADAGTHQVVALDPAGRTILRLGGRGVAAGEFNYPTWVALDGAGDVYVTDALNFRVQIFDPQGRPLGRFGHQGDGSGELARPKGIGVDRNGYVYLVDALFDAVQLFDREGRYLMVFGGGGEEPGHFWLPSGLAIDGDRIYVADSYNRRVQVFRILGGAS